MNRPDYFDGTESAADSARIAAVAERLESEKPKPTPAFRGELGRRLNAEPGRPVMSPRRAKTLALAYGASGSLLFALAAAGLAGIGPFTA